MSKWIEISDTLVNFRTGAHALLPKYLFYIKAKNDKEAVEVFRDYFKIDPYEERCQCSSLCNKLRYSIRSSVNIMTLTKGKRVGRDQKGLDDFFNQPHVWVTPFAVPKKVKVPHKRNITMEL